MPCHVMSSFARSSLSLAKIRHIRSGALTPGPASSFSRTSHSRWRKHPTSCHRSLLPLIGKTLPYSLGSVDPRTRLIVRPYLSFKLAKTSLMSCHVIVCSLLPLIGENPPHSSGALTPGSTSSFGRTSPSNWRKHDIARPFLLLIGENPPYSLGSVDPRTHLIVGSYLSFTLAKTSHVMSSFARSSTPRAGAHISPRPLTSAKKS
ncbi:hypothetical protein M422DRAFT_238785 [Sphaerobolus stellatus SS14]|nr:hypothetical protein M422DRAFT_238785 [Sphaerobolus stellatus SS14]